MLSHMVAIEYRDYTDRYLNEAGEAVDNRVFIRQDRLLPCIHKHATANNWNFIEFEADRVFDFRIQHLVRAYRLTYHYGSEQGRVLFKIRTNKFSTANDLICALNRQTDEIIKQTAVEERHKLNFPKIGEFIERPMPY